MTYDRPRLLKQLERHEGLRLKPYLDTVGKTTIGIGRNLSDVGITKAEAYAMLEHDLARTESDLLRALPWVATLNDVRQRVLVNMAFNLGVGGLVKFQQTLAAIKRGDYATAAANMLASKWARQVGNRARELAEMMRAGTDDVTLL